MSRTLTDQQWLASFHAGDAATLEKCYRENLPAVAQAVGQLLRGADKETVIHEVFFRLISDQQTRLGFRDGSFGAWINTVARNLALDFVRRHRKEHLVEPKALAALAGGRRDAQEARVEARQLVDEFQRCLPAKWAPVFEARFIRQLDQRSAAAELGMQRTTLAYREAVIRKRLRRFLLRQERP